MLQKQSSSHYRKSWQMRSERRGPLSQVRPAGPVTNNRRLYLETPAAACMHGREGGREGGVSTGV